MGQERQLQWGRSAVQVMHEQLAAVIEIAPRPRCLGWVKMMVLALAEHQMEIQPPLAGTVAFRHLREGLREAGNEERPEDGEVPVQYPGEVRGVRRATPAA